MFSKKILLVSKYKKKFQTKNEKIKSFSTFLKIRSFDFLAFP